MGKLGELVELCHELNGGDFSVIFDYLGHVNRFSLWVHMGGWTESSQGVPFGHSVQIDIVPSAIDWLKQKHEENKRLQAERAKNAERDAKALEEIKTKLTPEQIKIIKELA